MQTPEGLGGMQTPEGLGGSHPTLGMLLGSLNPSWSPRSMCMSSRPRSQRRRGGQDQPSCLRRGWPRTSISLIPSLALRCPMGPAAPPCPGCILGSGRAGLCPRPRTGWKGPGRKGSDGLSEKGFIMLHIPFVLRRGFIYGRGRK